MMKIEKTTTWVTGASSGIGRGIAIALAQQGERVIASARNEQALKDLESQYENIIAVPCDICDEASLSSAKQQIEEMSPALDRVILNAGNCEYLDFPDPDWDTIRRVMEVNFFGTINSVQLALPLLRRSTQRAHIVTVASQVTGAPFPRAEAYGASKAALQYFFASLRIDLADEKIDVTLVNPGFVDTPLTQKNNFEMPFLMTVDEAVEVIVEKIKSRPRSFSFPRKLSVLLSFSKVLPALWQKRMIAESSNQKKQGVKK